MKIFGHYLFEEDPELIAYREEKRQREYKEMVASCENDGKEGSLYPPLPNIPAGTYHSFMGSVDRDKMALWVHNDQKKQGKCHKFNGKKYCYHTGKEIIKEVNQS